MTFFEREPEKPQPVPQAADADLDLALSRQPRLYFLDRRVGMLDDVHPEGFVMRRKLSTPIRNYGDVFWPRVRLRGDRISC